MNNRVREFRTHVKENWLTIPTNTQLVERWVKDANKCTFNTKDDNLSDAVAILRSTTIFRHRRKAIRLSEGRSLSANQHRTAGVAGSRINRNTGEEETKEKIKTVKGTFYNQVLINEVVTETKKFKKLNAPTSVRKRILQRIKNSHMSFQTVRTNATLTAHSKTMQTPITTPNNAIVNTTGFDVTDHMQGRFPYGKLLTTHIPLVRAEIIHRGGDVDPKMKIRALGKCLLALDLERQRLTYREMTGIDARDQDLNRSAFEPSCRTADFNALLQKE